MADSEYVWRSNYFRVKDLAALEEIAARAYLELSFNDAGQVCILGALYEDWPFYDPDTEEPRLVGELDIADVVAPLLANGEVAVFVRIGHEKLRSLSGDAVAINNQGDRRQISLFDIYEAAKDLGPNVTTAGH